MSTVNLLTETEVTILTAAANIMAEASERAWIAHLEDGASCGRSQIDGLGVFRGKSEAAISAVRGVLVHASVHRQFYTPESEPTAPVAVVPE